MSDEFALIRLPDPATAPGYRSSLSTLSHFSVDDFNDGIVGVRPAEGAGAVHRYFNLVKICDSGSDFTNAEIWSPVREKRPRQRSGIDGAAYRDKMLQRGQKIAADNPGNPSEIVKFALAVFGACQVGELDQFLAATVPDLLNQFPEGSLWYITTEDVLLSRLAFARTQFAFQVTPDMPVGTERDALRALSGLGFTGGVNFAEAMNIPLLALSPSVLGFAVPAIPHTLVFCFGLDLELRRPYPHSLTSIYRPTVLSDSAGIDRSAFLNSTSPDDGPQLLEWWVDRLNLIYSHASDPTRFTDSFGYFEGTQQAAWLITFERVIGDMITLLSEPQATDLDRVQMAFDLLDKLEGLLGFAVKKSSKAFEALLRRSRCAPLARASFDGLPGNLGGRMADEVDRLFEGLYREVRENTLDFRRTENGAKIAAGTPENLRAISNDQLVSSLLRAVRNSSHGLQQILREHPDRFLLAANTGDMPAELASLVPLIALALLADAENLIDGTWRSSLVGN